MLDVHRLRILRELSRLGTLARVAELLHYTPSAVSHQLALLEKEAGVRLTERVGRGLRLTHEAEGLVEHTEAVLARLEQAEADLAASQHVVLGRVRVGAFQSALLSVVPRVLDRLAEHHPGVDLQVLQREVQPAYEALRGHVVDMVIGEEYPGLDEPKHEGVQRTDIGTDPLHLVLPTTGPWSREGLELMDLAEAPWALDPAGTPSGDWARAVCRGAGFEPRIRLETPNPQLQAHLVRTGHALAMVPALLGEPHLDGTRSVVLPGRPERTIYAAVRSGSAEHPLLRACREAFAQEVRQR